MHFNMDRLFCTLGLCKQYNPTFEDVKEMSRYYNNMGIFVTLCYRTFTTSMKCIVNINMPITIIIIHVTPLFTTKLEISVGLQEIQDLPIFTECPLNTEHPRLEIQSLPIFIDPRMEGWLTLTWVGYITVNMMGSVVCHSQCCLRICIVNWQKVLGTHHTSVHGGSSDLTSQSSALLSSILRNLL